MQKLINVRFKSIENLSKIEMDSRNTSKDLQITEVEIFFIEKHIWPHILGDNVYRQLSVSSYPFFNVLSIN